MRKTVKTLLTVIISLVMSVTFVGCERNLQDYADLLNEKCPIDNLDDGLGVLKCCEIIGDYFVYHIEVDEDKLLSGSTMTLEELGTMPEFREMSILLKKELLNDKEYGNVFKQCKKENKGVKMTMKGDKSGKTITILKISPEEFQKLDF